MAREPVRVGGLFLNVTTRCNMRCPGCYGHLSPFPQTDMAPATARAATRMFFANRMDAAERGGRDAVLMLFGGEPLLNPGLLREWIPWVLAEYPPARNEYRLALTTNGMDLDADMAGFLVRHGVEVFVSIDGHYRDHRRRRPVTRGEYGRLAGVCRDLTARAPTGVSSYTVLPLEGVERVGRVLDALMELGFRVVSLARDACEQGWTPGVRERLYRRLSEYKERRPELSLRLYPEIIGGCTDCRAMYAMVYPDGEVYDLCFTCGAVWLGQGGAPVALGDLFRLGNVHAAGGLTQDRAEKYRLMQPRACWTLTPEYGPGLVRLMDA